MAKTLQISAGRVRELFNYEPETGFLTWKSQSVGRGRCHMAGDRAGCAAGNRRQVCVDGTTIKEHRVIWAWLHGKWPDGDVDHINGDATDNRSANLRDVPRSVNLQNQRKQRAGCATGLLGVYKNHRSFTAAIYVDGRSLNLGNYATADAAHGAYIQAKRLLHPGCTI